MCSLAGLPSEHAVARLHHALPPLFPPPHWSLLSIHRPQIYKHYFNALPYDSRDVGPWKIVALNSMYGARERQPAWGSGVRLPCPAGPRRATHLPPTPHPPTLRPPHPCPRLPATGRTWDPTDPRCAVPLSSYGEEQLRWLDAQLAEGKPTLVMVRPGG